MKGTVTAINEDLEHADAFKLIAEIKETLTDREFALNLGSRNRQPTNTIATVKEGSEDGDLPECTEIYCPNNRVAFTRNRQGGKRQTRGSEQQERRDCYICGGRHYWRFCPEKRCPSCGQKGHTLKDCSILSKGRNSHSVLSTKLDGLGAELSVLIAIKLIGKQTNGLLDSGAGPSVIDIGTVRELGLEQSMRIKEGQVYGISREPVYVVGELELTVDLGDKQVLEHKFEVLKVTGTTCILGRDLLKKLGTTEVNWQSQKVRLGNTWKNSHATIEGGEPITRASVAAIEGSENLEQMIPRDIINPNLPSDQKSSLSRLLDTFKCVFAQNPKRPQCAKAVTHRIDTGSAPPNKQRPIPVAPAVEAEIAEIVEEMLQNGICRPSNSPWASRVLLVTKRDGSKRFVVDYRQLNEVTRIDSYPMPNAKDILDG